MFKDKDIRILLALVLGTFIFSFILFPRINFENIMNFDFSNPSTITKDEVPITKFSVDQNLDYQAQLITTLGSIKIDLLEKNSPKNLTNILNNYPKYSNATVGVPQQNFILKITSTDKNNLNANTDDEINADFLGLNKTKVGNATFLSQLYVEADKNTHIFKSENLSKYSDFTLTEFYSSILGYQYDPKLETPSAKKYMIYMASEGPKKNGLDMFILMTDNAPQIDGRYTPIGQVTEGFDILDKINQSNQDIKIKNLVITSK